LFARYTVTRLDSHSSKNGAEVGNQGGQLRRQPRRQAGTHFRTASRRGGRAALLRIPLFRRQTEDISHDPIAWPGGTRSGGEFHHYGCFQLTAIALATTLIPLSTLLLVAPLPHARPDFTRVVRAVWVLGLGLALSSVGLGAITTFIVLLFAQHGWGQAWLAFTVLSIAFMARRLIFGHLPDKIGKQSVMRHRRAAASPWVPTSLFSIWR
jgi:hypothetical protein